MNIYEIGQDFDNYKFFVFKEDDESNKGVWDYNGQSLINEWKGLSLELFRDKRKKKDKRSEEFDASCYFSGCLIVNKRTSLLLSEKLKGQIEVLPVNVDGNASGYYFINVLNTVDALNIESKSNEEILKMMRDNNGIFRNKNRIYDGLTIICYINTFFDLTYIKKRPSCKEMASSNIDYYAVIFASHRRNHEFYCL